MKKIILGELLHLANQRFQNREFYSIKDQILEKYGKPAGHHSQHIIHHCHECGGTSRKKSMAFGNVWPIRCPDCEGSGIYSQFWIMLKVYRLGLREFHLPMERITMYHEFESRYKHLEVTAHFEGKIQHKSPPFYLGDEAGWWLVWLFRPNDFMKYGFGRVHYMSMKFTPMVVLCSLVFQAKEKWRSLRTSIVQFHQAHCRHEFPIEKIDFLDRECKKCGISELEALHGGVPF